MGQYLSALPGSNKSNKKSNYISNEEHITYIKTDTNEGLLAPLGVTYTVDKGSEKAELCSVKHISNSDESSNNSPLADTPLDTTPTFNKIHRDDGSETKDDELHDNSFTSNESSTEHGVCYDRRRYSATNQAFAAPKQLKTFTNTGLHDAVNNENVPLIQFLIGSGHDVNARGPHGRTALMCAVFTSPGCEPKSTLIAKILLAHGANVDAQDDNGMTALHFASKDGDAEMVRILITVGASTSIRDNKGFDFLDHAFSNPSVPLPSLHDAVNNENVPLIRFLIGSGHDVDARGPHGRTALMCAVFASPEHGCTPKTLDIINILVSCDADVNAKDNDGMSALHFAADDDDDELVNILLSRGASVNSMNNEGRTPLDLAIAKEHICTPMVLESHGANNGVSH